MSFLERLLDGIKAREVLELKAEELKREEANGKASELAQQKQRYAIKLQTEQEMRSQEIKTTLEEFSVVERLEAIRDGVWKVGEVKPFANPQTGYYLEHIYPAAIPIIGTISREWYEDVHPGYGRTHREPIGTGVVGHLKGRRQDIVIIEVRPESHSTLRLFAAGGLNIPDPSLPSLRLEDHAWYWKYAPLTAEEESSSLDPMKIDHPNSLEMLLIAYSRDAIKRNKLPLQSEADAREQLIAKGWR